MLFGGLIIQVLIQAAILQLSLKLIAKHEADTSFSKAAMVTAGVMVGNFLVILLLGKIFPLLIWPAQIALTAAVIMTFCWISFWKSVIVVLVFVAVQIIFAVIMAVIFGFSMASIFISAAKDGGGLNLDYKHPAEPRNDAMHQEALLIQQEAMRMQQKALEKQARIEEELRRAEMDEPAPDQTTQKKYTPPPPKREPTRRQPYSRRTSPDRVDWDGAMASLRMGGVVAGANGNMAMINGKMLEAGDTVETEHNGRQYRWIVKHVSKTKPTLEQIAAE